MYAITRTTVMCNGERTGRVVAFRFPSRQKAIRAMKRIYHFYAEWHRPEPIFDEVYSIITLPSSAEELEEKKYHTGNGS